MYELTVESTFSAAHQLLKSNTPCENLHGHNWRVMVFVRGSKLTAEVGWLVDFAVLKKMLNEVLATLDHKILNEVLLTSPTAEYLAKYVYEDMQRMLMAQESACALYKVSVWETEKACASYYKE